ncbi:MAG: class I SAM-dependent methyltransferase [Cyanobacteria bacterium P01_C01_bin.89]
MPNSSSPPSPESSEQSAELAALRRQFDGTPYPWVSIEENIKESPAIFHQHSLATAFYRRDFRQVDTTGMTILDVGCGSGYKALALAHVNPGTTVVGIDISPKSIELAKQRAEFWELSDRLQFHVLDVDNLEQLGQIFDYINCDETLYLLPQPLASLKVLNRVLAADGILRTNLHNYNQRLRFLNAQKAFSLLDPISSSNSQDAIDNVSELLENLSPKTFVKSVWTKADAKLNPEKKVELIQANFLLHGDRAFTLAETFTLLEQSNLEWCGLVAPQRWDWKQVFTSEKSLPDRLKTTILSFNERQRLELVNGLLPDNRLIDFWCSHTPPTERSPLEDWSPEQWETATVAWHPILQTDDFHRDLITAARSLRSFNLQQYFNTPQRSTEVNAALLPALLPLQEGAQPFAALVDRLEQVYPLNPIEQTPVQREHLAQTLITLLQNLEDSGHIFIEE